MTTPIAWSRRAADELWSGVVTPLTFSILAEQMAEHMAQQRLRQAGLLEASQQPVFRLIRGHVYVNASLIHDVLQEVPGVFLSDGVLALLPEELRGDLRGGQRALYDPRTIATIARLTWNESGWTPWSRAELFREEAARVAEELAGFSVRPDATATEIGEQIGRIRERLGRFLDVVSWAMIYAYVFFHLAAHLSRDWLPEEESLAVLVAGIPGIRTFEVHAELSALADSVRTDPELRARVVESSPADVIEAADRGELGEFGRALSELRRRHGHRLIGRDLVFPTWGERPEVLVEMICSLARSEPAAPRKDHAAVLERARRTIGSGFGGAARWKIFEAGLGWCQEYYAVRENMRYHADYFLSAFRALARAAAHDLVARGLLREEADVFYLTVDELESVLLRPGEAGAFGDRAARRREGYQEYRDAVPPAVVWGDGDGESSQPSDRGFGPNARGATELRGTPASPGTAVGPVRVVRSAGELESVQRGDLIVASATDPAWTSYLSLASGLVLEVGGLLSHGAIIARELGIPAIVDLAGATTALQSGERIRIDGSRGIVERI